MALPVVRDSAGSAKLRPIKSRHGRLPKATSGHEIDLEEVKIAAANLYGRCYSRTQISRILLDHLVSAKRPNGEMRTQQEMLRLASNKLGRWEKEEKFRDIIYDQAVVKLDLEVPKILEGISRRARNRVDAARLVLEVTGRHNPRGDQQPTQVTVQIANIPRPE